MVSRQNRSPSRLAQREGPSRKGCVEKSQEETETSDGWPVQRATLHDFLRQGTIRRVFIFRNFKRNHTIGVDFSKLLATKHIQC